MFTLAKTLWSALDVWRAAGADQSANMEIVLWVAAIEHWNARAGKHEKELTNAQWVTVRKALATELALSGPDKPLDEIVSRVSGGLERTRSLLREAKEDKQTLVQALVPLLASASHGLTSAPYLDSFLLALLGSQSGDTIYCPFDGSFGLPLSFGFAGHKVNFEAPNNRLCDWTKLLAFLGDLPVATRCNDPLRNPSWVSAGKLDAFEYSAAIPSFGYRPKMESLEDKFRRFPLRLLYGEALQLAHLLAQTAKRAVVVMPEGFLFRTAGGEQKFKEMLVRKGTLSAVIRLPRDVFIPSSSLAASILIFELEGAGRDNVLFVDASEDFGRKGQKMGASFQDSIAQVTGTIQARKASPISHVASYEEIAKNDFNISAGRYVVGEEKRRVSNALAGAKSVPLQDIAEIIRPQMVSSDGSPFPTVFREVSLQDIEADGTIREPGKVLHVNDLSFSQAARQQLQKDDILLSTRGRIGAVGIVPPIESGGWIPSQAFVILRLRASATILSPVALFRYLSSDLGQKLLQSLATGTTVPMVPMSDLKKLPIMIPTVKENAVIEADQITAQKIREEIKALEKRLEEYSKTSWPMNKLVN